MKVHKGYNNIQLIKPVATMGVFDGVHKGHRNLLEKVVSAAKANGGESVVITFYPHPRTVLDTENSGFQLLSTLEEKEYLISETGVDHLIIREFTTAFSKTGACEFVKDELIGILGVNHLIIGYDHRFGKHGEGDPGTIAKCPGLEGFIVEKAEGVFAGKGAISSSVIRELLLSGKLDEANAMLGYNYQLSGTVVEGKKLGRALGFPTANISPGNEMKLVPSNGVYAVRVRYAGSVYPGMLSIGVNPTVNAGRSERTIEVNIIGFNGDIYGEKIALEFVKWLREEKKFENIGRLVAQMELDRQETLRLLP